MSKLFILNKVDTKTPPPEDVSQSENAPEPESEPGTGPNWIYPLEFIIPTQPRVKCSYKYYKQNSNAALCLVEISDVIAELKPLHQQFSLAKIIFCSHQFVRA